MRDLFDQNTLALQLDGPGRKGKRPKQVTQHNFHHILTYFKKIHGEPRRLTDIAIKAPAKDIPIYLIEWLQIYIDEHALQKEWVRCLNMMARKKADLKRKTARIPVSQSTMRVLEEIKEGNMGMSWDELLFDMAKKYVGK